MLPDWMLAQPAPPPESKPYGTKRWRVSAPISSFYQVARRELVMGESALRPGFLQGMDARVKIVLAIVMILATSMLTSLPLLAGVFVSTIVVAALSRVSLPGMLKLLAGPAILTCLLILPAILNVITPGATLVSIGHIGEGRSYFGMQIPSELTITHQGVSAALRFVLRSITCVTLALALVMSSGPRALLKALRSIGLPRIFALTLQMMYCYLFVLIQYAEDTQKARKSRTIRKMSTTEKDRHAAGEIGKLFQTARRLADQVHLAMIARGFSGSSQ